MLAEARKLADGKAMTLPRRRAVIAAIEATRQARGIPHEDLCRRAGVTLRCWQLLTAGRRHGTAATLRRLARAAALDPRPLPDALVRQLAFDAIMRRLTAGGAAEPEARARAIYIGHVELGWSQAEAASLAGVSKQFAARVTRRLEERRDEDQAFEAAIAAALAPLHRKERSCQTL